MTAPSTKNAPAFDRLLTPEDTAAALGVSLSWLAKARLTGPRMPEPGNRDGLMVTLLAV